MSLTALTERPLEWFYSQAAQQYNSPGLDQQVRVLLTTAGFIFI